MGKKQQQIQRWRWIAAVGMAVVLLYWLFATSKSEPKPVGATPNTPAQYVNALGQVTTTPNSVLPRVVGIMVDNHPDARPQSGLDQARVVYEALAEGGITRYLAIFDVNESVSEVGPVRSARPYYIDWIREYGDNPYLHCGGSPEALSKIKAINLFDVDQFYNDPYFWRADYREAPHNLYTNTERWTTLLAKPSSQARDGRWDGWLFSLQPGMPTSSTAVHAAALTYNRDYVVRWDWSVEDNVFKRSINGKAHQLTGNKTIGVANVAILEVGTKVLDEVGRREMSTVGNGSLRLLRGGQLIRGMWKKESATARTRFYDHNNQEIPLAPGQTWVQIVPIDTPVEITS